MGLGLWGLLRGSQGPGGTWHLHLQHRRHSRATVIYLLLPEGSNSSPVHPSNTQQ